MARLSNGATAMNRQPTARATAADARAPLDVSAATAELDSALHELIAIYQRLLEIAERRREAINAADPRGLASCVAEENDLIQRIADVEKRRMVVAAQLAGALGLPDKSQTTVTAIAARLTGEAAARLSRSAGTLREIAERVRRTNEIVRSAAETLAAHIEGLMRTVQNQLTRTTTYEARGRMASRLSPPAALDIRH
jgi:plasmid maintenance system antidote protein VapI